MTRWEPAQPGLVNLETVVAVEQTRAHLVPKPWGRTDLRPWNVYHDAGAAMGVVGLSAPTQRLPPLPCCSSCQQAIDQLRPHEPSCIVAMTDPDHTHDYPPAVRLQINDRNLEDYGHAAHVLNMARREVVSLQHEFGIFGGEAGGHTSAPTSRLTMPARHDAPYRTLAAYIGAAPRSRRDCRDFLTHHCHGRERQGTAAQRVSSGRRENRAIPRGTPDCAFVEPAEAKAALDVGGRPAILTFGLRSSSKGIEVMIDAMPEILRTSAIAVYVILGATHPNLIRDQGEAYRDGLMRRVRALGTEDHISPSRSIRRPGESGGASLQARASGSVRWRAWCNQLVAPPNPDEVAWAAHGA